MPAFSDRSKQRLDTCDPRLQRVFYEVVKHFDCSVLQGYRGEAEQEAYFRTGRSKTRWPYSKHNHKPSKAADVAPYPIDLNDREYHVLFAGYVLGIAATMGIRLRWGGDWNMNDKTKDNSFDDLVHFELLE